MRGAVRLGLRLTGVGTGPARLRSATVALATAAGALVLLCLAAVAHAEQVESADLYRSSGMRMLLLVVVCSVALPVLVLAATAGRLSAELRDRRLANLRLLGLTPTQTRTVAVTEAGTTALIGTAVGLLLFWALRPLLAGIHVSGRHWTRANLTPTLIEYVVVLAVLTITVVILAVLPQRLDMRTVLARAHRVSTRRPSWWRLAPVTAGVLLCGTIIATHPDGAESTRVVLALFGGIGLTGIGMILMTPVLVHLMAWVLVRSGGPVCTVAGRRLQAQPVGVTRVVSALLIGLFLVTGARAVVVAFESTPQYVQAARQIQTGQRLVLNTSRAEAVGLVDRLNAVEGVRQSVALPQLVAGTGCQSGNGYCVQGIVATCAQLHAVAPSITGCRDGQPMWLSDDPGLRELPANRVVNWYPMRNFTPTRRTTTPTTLPPPTATVDTHGLDDLAPVDATVLLPPSAVNVATLPTDATTEILVLGTPGRGLADVLEATPGLGPVGFSGFTFEDYDFVAGLRALVWGVAAVILSIGLLTFAVAAIDRAVTRRREIIRLQLLGVPARLLRRSQWLEAALPITVGTLLAIGLGLLSGASYLALAQAPTIPWTQSLTLAAVSVGSAAVIAGLTVLAANPKIRPDLIRAE